MATLTLRSVKGTPLTNNEVDDNFTNINNELIQKIDLTDLSGTGDITYNSSSGVIQFNNTTGYITDVVDDSTPQLGGTLDANGNNIDMGTNIITDTKVGQWDDAYSWGDHSVEGYLTTETSTLDDVVGRGATTTTDVTINAELTAQSYNETVGTITSTDLDLETGNVFNDSISANTTYTFSNPPASGTAYGFTLKVSVTGTRTITWPTSVDWPGGTAPAAPADGETDVYAFYTTDGGTTYYGFQAGDAMA